MESAIRYMGPGNPEFIEIEEKDPEEGCVGIRIIASSLCNSSELRSFRGGYANGYGSGYPMETGEPGHEAVGTVVRAGKSTTGFSTGDYVIMTGHGGEPCHRSYVNRNQNDIARIFPDGRNPAEAAVMEMYGCARHCAMTPLNKNEYAGRKVLVIGMGAMGLCTIQILADIGEVEISAMDIDARRLSKALESGAGKVLFPHEAGQSFDADIVFECSGSVNGQQLACAIAPRILIFSSYNTNEIRIRQDRLFDANTTIYNPGILGSESLRAVAELYNSKRIRPDILVEKRIKPEKHEYLDAIEGIKAGKFIKVLIEWS
ncbi:MAG: zinc-binding dehydrogenase [Clostridia bacterium]|nr:zinc-binding dehydrogenase [Clostridia bacterium]